MRRLQKEAGSIAPVMAMGALVMGLMGIGGAALGRVIAARADAQRAADSAALSVADLIRDQGLSVTRTQALAVGAANSPRHPVTITETYEEPLELNVPGRLIVHVDDSEAVQVPAFINTSGSDTVRSHANAYVGEYVTDLAWQASKLLFVLDFSGSMQAQLPGSSQQAIQVLKDSLTTIINWQLPIEYSAVLFSTDLIGFEPFVDPQGGNVTQKILQLLKANGANGSTETELGMGKAYDIVKAENHDRGPGGGFNVVLVSDGQPDDGAGPPALAFADNLRDDFGKQNPELTMWAFHIDWSGGTDQTLRDFMLQMTGTKDKMVNGQKVPGHPDPSYYFRIVDTDSLDTALAALLARIGCPVGPLDTRQVEDETTVHVFARDAAGFETLIPRDDNIVGLNTLNVVSFAYVKETGMIYPTIKACQQISNAREEVVVRYNPSHLSPN